MLTKWASCRKRGLSLWIQSLQTPQGIMSHGVCSFGVQAAAATRAFSHTREIFAFCRSERLQISCYGPSVPLFGEPTCTLSRIVIYSELQSASTTFCPVHLCCQLDRLHFAPSSWTFNIATSRSAFVIPYGIEMQLLHGPHKLPSASINLFRTLTVET